VIVEHEQLQSMTGLQKTAALRRALRKAGIPFREHNGRLFTTEEAITAVLVGRTKKRDEEGPNFDALPPPKVRVKSGSYWFDHGAKDESGKRRWTFLSRVSDGEHKLYEALALVTRPQSRTVNDLIDAYAAHGLLDLKPATQREYLRSIKARLRPVFGAMAAEKVTTADVAVYLERRKEAGNRVAGNHEIACLSSVFEYGLRHRLCESNPCRGVRRNKVRPRRRYVRNDEFLAIFHASHESMQDVLALAYLTGLRSGELCKLRRSQLLPGGITIEESKTGKLKVVEWSEAVRFFVLRSCSRHPSSPFVLTNSQGDPWGTWAIQSAMRRARAKVGGAPFNLHDLRAKAESDSKEGMGLLPLYKRARRVRPVR
jgi:integrase